MATNVLTLIGSLRRDSTNRQLAEATIANSPAGMAVEIFEGLETLPFYNEDIDVEGQVPFSAIKLRTAAEAADALLLVSPEYNGTIPAVLKNAIDWLSRPFGASAVSNMPTAVIGTAAGRSGGKGSQDEARKAVDIAGGYVLETAKLSIPNSLVRFAEVHPKDDAEVVGQVTEVLERIRTATEECRKQLVESN
ncbi:NAD(P)H-dependent oxidoreductase [Glutamicibacter nicotianae]|uniref:FMN reductase n=1 Tax=Glutamicibacter nicotianae TaxID=37929 RepID=A0ABQ0RQJ9_GLUNI|nr:NADPH-dependent FMN reductase [Glutamicibacter nicotianae]GEC14101.1 FMN reductase [Glutamicibacter nicotianae]